MINQPFYNSDNNKKKIVSYFNLSNVVPREAKI